MMEQALLEGERMYDILAKSARVALAYTATQVCDHVCNHVERCRVNAWCAVAPLFPDGGEHVLAQRPAPVRTS